MSATPPAQQVFADPQVAALAEAAARGDVAKVRALAPTTDLNARGDRGVTPLQFAMLSRNPAGFEALLRAGADPTRNDEAGDTVVHYAALADDPRYLRLLLDHGTKPDLANAREGRSPLYEALAGHRHEQLRMLLQAKADPDFRSPLGDTPLLFAARIGDLDAVLILLEAGADPAARNRQDVSFQTYLNMGPPGTALSELARAQRQRIADWLQSHGQKVELREALH